MAAEEEGLSAAGGIGDVDAGDGVELVSISVTVTCGGGG